MSPGSTTTETAAGQGLGRNPVLYCPLVGLLLCSRLSEPPYAVIPSRSLGTLTSAIFLPILLYPLGCSGMKVVVVMVTTSDAGPGLVFLGG